MYRRNIMVTLHSHRKNLQKNPLAYSEDIERCYTTVVKHLKDAGYKSITLNRAPQEIQEYVDLLFLAQDQRPYFHIETSSMLPFCWNSPSKNGWDINYIKYEWGHLQSINQNEGTAHNIENLCLQSARCNQHIQSSLNVDELKAYGGKLEEVIIKNELSRKQLFESDQWKDLLNRLEKWKD